MELQNNQDQGMLPKKKPIICNHCSLVDSTLIYFCTKHFLTYILYLIQFSRKKYYFYFFAEKTKHYDKTQQQKEPWVVCEEFQPQHFEVNLLLNVALNNKLCKDTTITSPLLTLRVVNQKRERTPYI